MPRRLKAKPEHYEPTLGAYIDLAKAIPEVRMILLDEDSGSFG